MPEIQQVSNRHEAILNHLIANPTMSLGAVALAFGYTQAWLSCIIHSDAFQCKLKERQDVVFHSTILPITEKMQAVAHIALDRLVERLPAENEPKNLSSIAGDVLDRLGYAAPKGGTVVNFQQNNVQNNHMSTLRQEIDNARALLVRGPPPLEVAHNGDRAVIALPAGDPLQALQIPGEPGLGEADPGAPVSPDTSPDPGGETGSEIREESPLAVGRAV